MFVVCPQIRNIGRKQCFCNNGPIYTRDGLSVNTNHPSKYRAAQREGQGGQFALGPRLVGAPKSTRETNINIIRRGSLGPQLKILPGPPKLSGRPCLSINTRRTVQTNYVKNSSSDIRLVVCCYIID